MISFWWILALVFAFVGGQMLMLRPNKREQAELLLRNTAKKMNIQPHLVPPPKWLKTNDKQFIACYSVIIPTAKMPYWRAEKQSDHSWKTVAGDDFISKQPIPDMASVVLAVEGQANSVSFYWYEEAGIEALEPLKNWMEALAR
jgi:hypothetical protein